MARTHAETLDELKTSLYEQFNTAKSRFGNGIIKDSAEFAKAAALTAQAIVAIEREQREASSSGSLSRPL